MNNLHYQSTIKHAIPGCDFGVNTYTGDMVARIPLLAMGINSYAFGVGLTYSPNANNPEIQDPTLPPGWKTSLFTPIKRISSIGSNPTCSFTYRDSSNNYYQFTKGNITDSSNKYSEITGSGLVLLDNKADNTLILLGTDNSKLVFEQFGAFYLPVSISMGSEVKTIKYTNNKVAKIYDKKRPSRYISFQYGNGMLASLRAWESDKKEETVKITQADKQLSTLSLINKLGHCKNILHFKYESGKLSDVISDESRKEARITYNNLGKVMRFETGFITCKMLIKGQNKYLLNDGNRSGVAELLNSDLKYDLSGYHIDEYVTYKYEKNYLETVNEKGVVFQHYHRFEGEITGILEKIGNSYRQISPSLKESISLQTSNSSGNNFDETKIINTRLGMSMANADKYSIEGKTARAIHVRNDSDYLKKMNQDKDDIRFYSFAAWVKIIELSSSPMSLYVMAIYTGGKGSTLLKVDIASITDTWQYVHAEIPLENHELAAVKVVAFEGDNFDISNMQFSPLAFYPGLRYSDKFIPLNQVENIRIYRVSKNSNVSLKMNRVNQTDSFLTAKDIIAYQLQCHINGNDLKVFTHNGLREYFDDVIEVWLDFPGSISIKLDKNAEKDPIFSLREYYGEKKYFSEVFTYFSNKTYNESKPGFEDIVRHEKVTYNLKEKAGEAKKSFDLYGRLLDEVDEDEVRKIYEYDQWGNLCQVITGLKDNKEGVPIMCEKYTYSKTPLYDRYGPGEIMISESNEIGAEIYYNYENERKNITLFSGNVTDSYEYDSYKERVIKRERKKSTEDHSTQTTYYNYNDRGLISMIYDSLSARTAEMYYDNMDGSVSDFWLNGKLWFFRQVIDGTEKEVKMTYSNDPGTTIRTISDCYGREKAIYENNDLKYYIDCKDQNGEIASNSKVRSITDNYSDAKTTFKYTDSDKKLYGYEYSTPHSSYSYDANTNSDDGTEYISHKLHFGSTSFAYDKELIRDSTGFIDPKIFQVKEGETITKYLYDALGRVDTKTICSSDWAEYVFVRYKYDYHDSLLGKIDGKKVSTNLISNLLIDSSHDSDTWEYSFTYTNFGQLKSKTVKFTNSNPSKNYTKHFKYSYDYKNRLEQEEVYSGLNDTCPLVSKKKIIYSEKQNIIKILENGVEKVYNYDNGKLIGFDNKSIGNFNFEYDDLGNPVDYYSLKDLDTHDLEWTRGQMLAKYDDIKFTYNASGFRTRKNNIEYLLDGEKIVAENHLHNGYIEYQLIYHYDLTGVIGFTYSCLTDPNKNKKVFRFVKDHQGNILKIKTQQSYDIQTYAEYEYDTFGNCKVVFDRDSIAIINPFRWKSHYLDTETNLYYISGNYYDPLIGQMISPKSYQEIVENPSDSEYALPGCDPIGFEQGSGSLMPEVDLSHRYPIKSGYQKARDAMNIAYGVIGIIAGTLLLAFDGGCTLFGTVLGVSSLIVSTVTLAMSISALVAEYTGIDYLMAVVPLSRSGYRKLKVALGISQIVLTVATIVYSMYGPKCFAAGTLVHTDKGLVPIEEVQEGTLVLAYDEKSGKQEYKEVVQLFQNESNLRTTLSIKADDGTIDEIISTPGHKYYLPDNRINRNANEKLEHTSYEGLSDKWVSAGLLRKGDRVLLANVDSLTGKPKYGIVINVKTEKCEKFTTYNFEVEDSHNYYVGKQGILVHNMNGIDCSGRTILDYNETPAYRGGESFELRATDNVTITKDGFVKLRTGPSVNTDIAKAAKFGTPTKITYLPDGLHLVQTGGDMGHFVIGASRNMTMIEYVELLARVNKPF